MDGCEGDQVQCGETQGGKEQDLKDLKDHKDHKEEEDRGVEKAGVGKGTGWHWWRSGVVTMVATTRLRRTSSTITEGSCGVRRGPTG